MSDFSHQNTEVKESDIQADAVLKQKASEFMQLSSDFAEKEAELNLLKDKIEGLNKDLVTLLVERGWSALPLIGGRKLELKEGVYARFPKNDPDCLKWLKNNGGEDLVKSSLVVDTISPEVVDALEGVGAEFAHTVDVNTNSLQAFFKRKLGLTKGSVRELEVEDVPKGFSLFEKKEVVLK